MKLSTGLLRLHDDQIVMQVRPADSNRVRPSEAGVEKNLHRDSLRRVLRPPSPIGSDVVLRPCAMPIGLDLRLLGRPDRIVRSEPCSHSIVEDPDQPLAEVACRCRRVRHLVDQVVHMVRLDGRNRTITMLLPKPLKDAAIDRLRR
nr:hypothetical protein [Aquamicrobium defluvii]